MRGNRYLEDFERWLQPGLESLNCTSLVCKIVSPLTLLFAVEHLELAVLEGGC